MFFIVLESAVMDVIIDYESLKCNIVEFNPFGAQLKTGSSLFHWINDYNQLHGKNKKKIEVRLINHV